ncbi:hypothetical protein B8W67_19965 [Mycolicibacillus koreensis]|uniref:Uncharacterized protein n=1 Tax=Mycolicibacillus koreensis TaxID=1069220 RepID=A0AA91PAD4_9MYCO|nr:hypothetical protein B8W67_19965 [Mycolicibacillus koreensis]
MIFADDIAVMQQSGIRKSDSDFQPRQCLVDLPHHFFVRFRRQSQDHPCRASETRYVEELLGLEVRVNNQAGPDFGDSRDQAAPCQRVIAVEHRYFCVSGLISVLAKKGST